MTDSLDQILDLLRDKIPREQDEELLKKMVSEYRKGGASAVKTAILDLIKTITEEASP